MTVLHVAQILPLAPALVFAAHLQASSATSNEAAHRNTIMNQPLFDRHMIFLDLSGQLNPFNDDGDGGSDPDGDEGLNGATVLTSGQELNFGDLTVGTWQEYVVTGGSTDQQCLCIADCTVGNLDLFLSTSDDYTLATDSNDWDCTSENSGEDAENCVVDPKSDDFNCFAVVYSVTAVEDCGITCSLQMSV